MDAPIETYNPSDPIAYVLSENLYRRHLSAGQKAVLALEVERLYSQEAKQKQIEAGGDRKSEEYKKSLTTDPSEPIIDRHERESTTRAAKAVGVGSTAVKRAKFLQQNAPEILDKVKQGEIAVDRAYNTTKARLAQMPKPEPIEPTNEILQLPGAMDPLRLKQRQWRVKP
ncbi:hypothetical protein L3556_14425 [Candidatus Synechococcus calcipolaris G9]|uniref:Uncharacterized protein n=1 Tax=Candidatus Synechococcus calcipolaris G9 TaxID=1497997 RepID=A0ABT6F2W1_9SYNE|nr:hypothetical protein [Candidatus Synechococcus calcipolaris]MDG2992116.1 hypothetical protein [Candidatus Synechococcus calcipolaris G9]